jgi:hypothetical protein
MSKTVSNLITRKKHLFVWCTAKFELPNLGFVEPIKELIMCFLPLPLRKLKILQ